MVAKTCGMTAVFCFVMGLSMSSVFAQLSDAEKLQKALQQVQPEVQTLRTQWNVTQGKMTETRKALLQTKTLDAGLTKTETNLRKATEMLTPMQLIPPIAVVIAPLNQALKGIHIPVGLGQKKATQVELRMKQERKTLQETSVLMQTTQQHLDALEKTTARLHQAVTEAQRCLHTLPAGEKRTQHTRTWEEFARSLHPVIEEIRSEVKSLGQVDVQKNLVVAIKLVNTLQPVTGVVTQIDGFLQPIEPVYSGLNQTLDRKLSIKYPRLTQTKEKTESKSAFSFFQVWKWEWKKKIEMQPIEFSVRQVLAKKPLPEQSLAGIQVGAGAIKKKFADMAMKLVDPWLEKLRVQAPAIPHLQQMHEKFDALSKFSLQLESSTHSKFKAFNTKWPIWQKRLQSPTGPCAAKTP